MAWTAVTRGDYVRPSGSYASDVRDREKAYTKPFKPGGFLVVAARSGDTCAASRLLDGGQPISPNPKGWRSAGRSLWLLAVAVAVLAGVAVPYGLLAGRETGLAFVSFWLLFGVVVIGLVALGVLRWRDEP